jgi:hypothetical protein
MDKNSKNKNKVMFKELALRLNNKGFYLQSNYCKYFLDSNNNGDLFLNKNERTANQKWEFFTPDTAGEYFLKNISTGLYLSSNDYGDLFTDVQILDSSYQRWKIHNTTDADNYTIINKANDLIISCNKTNKIIMKPIDPIVYEKLEFMFVFTFTAKKAVKK